MVMTKTDEEQQFADAVAIANIPTLLMVLVQLTGERQWMDAPYRPKRGRGMSDNDTGGLPEAVQQEIRDAALEAILAWRAGRPVAIPEPSYDLLVEMLGCAMGEPVPPEYGPMIAAQLGLQPFTEDRPLDVPEGFSVLVVGAGVSGLCAAYNLRRAGIPFVVLEKSANVGGTWWDNRYPGAGVDTPNHLYSFSFATYDWSMYFALRDELHDYLESVADRFDLRREVQFETEVVSMAYEADEQRWAVTVRRADGSTEVLHASVVISGTGIFNPLKYPDIPGLDRFEGPCFHTAQWPAGLDLTGQAGGHHRQRRQRHADRPRDPEHGGVAHHLPAVTALGGAVRAVPPAGARVGALPPARGPAVPVVVPHAPGLDLQRPDPPGPAEGSRTGSTRSAR